MTGPAGTAVAAGFGLVSRLRGARSVHPRGTGYRATLRIPAGLAAHPDVTLLARSGEHRALVRLSRGAGLPPPLPDVLGLAVRLPDAYGPGRHQDLLLASSADRPLLHHLLVPYAGDAERRTYSSILPYRVGGELRVFGAHGLHLALAPLGGRWEPFGELVLGAPLPAEETERLAFNPWNTGGGIRPAGPFNRIRRAAYRGSQAGRGLPPALIR